MAAEVITGWINSSGASGGLQYGGTFNREAGDLQIAAYKWDGADTSVAITDTDDATWTALTERLHTAGGSTLRAQVHLAKNVPFATDVNVFSTPAADVPNRELFVAQLRGLTADPMVNSDNITYHNAVSGTLSAASGDPGGDGIVVGILFCTEGDRTITPGSGWTAVPLMEGSQDPAWVHMVYKITDAAATPQWSVSGGTVVAMSVTLALEATTGGGGGGDTYVNAYLVQSARGMTGLTAHVWDGEPHEVLSTRYTGLATQDVTDPGGQPAALIQMTPAPAGTSDGDDVIVAVEDPASDKVSSWRVPGKVVGTPVVPSDALTTSDSRRMFIITPLLATNAQVDTALVQIQTSGPNPTLASVSDASGDLYNGEVRLKRVTDPIAGGAHKAFQHAIAPYFPAYQGGTWRSEITHTDSNSPGYVPRPGSQFWGFFAINPDANARSVGNISVFDLHAGYPTLNGGPSPLSFILGNGSVSIARSWNASYNAANPLGREWYSTSIAIDDWTIFFFQIKLHYDIAQGPFLRVWKKRGSSAIESVLNVSGPIGYNDPNPNAYPKFGAYTWGDGWSVNSPKCTIYHKGVQLFRDEAPGPGEPALGLQSLLATAEAL
jgi:hypothetical protein